MVDDVYAIRDERVDERGFGDRSNPGLDPWIGDPAGTQIGRDDLRNRPKARPSCKQRFDEARPEKPRGAGDEYLHRRAVMLPFPT